MESTNAVTGQYHNSRLYAEQYRNSKPFNKNYRTNVLACFAEFHSLGKDEECILNPSSENALGLFIPFAVHIGLEARSIIFHVY